MNFKQFLLEEEPISQPAGQKPVQPPQTAPQINNISVMRLTVPGIKELRDGVSEEDIRKSFPWIIKANIEDAVIGSKNGKLVWYNGKFDGNFEGGIWETGNFSGNFSGIFKSGKFSGTFVSGSFISGEFNGEFRQGKFQGNFKDGVFKTGAEFSGGSFKNGLFETGATFNNGTFSNGTFKGTFAGGNFTGGVFDGGKWLGGKWSGKGVWLTGTDAEGDILKSPPESAR